MQWLTPVGWGLGLASQDQWAPTLTSHDPDPPLPLETAPVDTEFTHASFAPRLAFKGLRRNPYVHHLAKDDSFTPPPEPDTLAPHLVRVPFRSYRPNRYVWHGSVEGVEQVNDASAGFLVVPSWDAFRLARASRYLYWRALDDTSAPPPAQPETLAPHLVRVPFRPYRPNRYRWHGAQDTSVPVEPPTHPPHPTPGRPFRQGAAGWPYRQHARVRFHFAQDTSAPVEAGPHVAHLVRIPFKRYAPNRYRFHTAQDTSVVGGGFQVAWARNANTVINSVGTSA